MVTKTIYTDPYMVVIDIGAVPPTEAWLQETTYLIDKSGHTTAMIAQTDHPTMGVSLQPVPFTPVNALISQAAPPTTTPSRDPTISPRKSSSSITVVALAAIGAVIGVAIMAASLYLLRRRALRQRLAAPISSLLSEDSATSGSSTSSISFEKFLDESKQSSGMERGLRPEKSMPSWESFLEEFERGKEKTDGSKLLSSKGAGPGMENIIGKRESTAELRERYDGLLVARQRSIRSSVESGPTTWGGLPASKAPASMTRQTEERKSAVAQPTSILKRNDGHTRKGVRLKDAVQGVLGANDKQTRNESVYNVDPIPASAKKTVTFGRAEIREFGRTPLPSSAGSMLGRDNAE